MKSIYIAGKITGDDNYRQKFAQTKKKLRDKGWAVLNPAHLPDGMSKEKYMPICLAMLEAADAICFLPDWGASMGAFVEHYYATYQDIQIYFGEMSVPMLLSQKQLEERWEPIL